MSNFVKPQAPLYSNENNAYFYPLTTVDQIIMEDGNRLNTKLGKGLSINLDGAEAAEPNLTNADMLGNKLPSYYATAEELGTKMSMELLWENANISSGFAAQTINLNLSIYSHIMIIFHHWNDNHHADSVIIPIGELGQIVTADKKTSVRYFSVTTTEIAFQDNYLYSTYGSSGVKDNGGALPFRIYGIKGVM